MRDEEIGRVQNYMSSNDNGSPTQDYGTSDFSRRPQCDSNLSPSLNLDDEKCAKNAPLGSGKQLGNMKLTSSLLMNKNSPQGTMA